MLATIHVNLNALVLFGYKRQQMEKEDHVQKITLASRATSSIPAGIGGDEWIDRLPRCRRVQITADKNDSSATHTHPAPDRTTIPMQLVSASVSCILSALVAMAFFVAPLAAETPQKNVLVIFVDDLRPELGCYGVDSIHSPSIDALAADGLLFESAYCQQALCAPSRISMLSGQYPDHTGICDLFTPLRRVSNETLTMPRYFQQRGYVTASLGKVYHHFVDDKTSWTELPPPPTHKYANPETIRAIERRVAEAQQQKLATAELRAAGKGPATEMFATDDDGYRDGIVAQMAIESLRRNKDKPFFMCVGFSKPHLPFAAPQRYWDLYQRDQFVVPQRERPADAPQIAFTKWHELRSYRGVPDEGHLSDELTRELLHGYAAAVSFADAQVGKVLTELDRLGLRENTVVVLWGDHGYKLGDYGMWCKHTNLELDTHVPLIVSAPGRARGQRTKALVEIVDLFPTLAFLTAGDIPASCDGKSFAAVLDDPSQNFRSFAVSQYQRGSTMGYSLRNDRWRYTEWIQWGTQKIVARELYDCQQTPSPPANLALQPQQADLVSQLSRQLDAAGRIKTTNVPMKTKGK